jgi:hypothetical protein
MHMRRLHRSGLRSRAQKVRTLMRQPALIVWALYLVSMPFYVFRSGLPQPGDLLVILLVPVAVAGWDGKLAPANSHMLRPLLFFTLWVCLVNYAWALVLGRWSNLLDFLIHPLFYVFNAAVLLAALIIARRDRDRFVRVTVNVVFALVLFQVAASFFYGTDLYRGELFFNSPNQLGFYALLAASMFAICQRPLGISRLRASIGITACAYLAVLSASRASLAGIAILLLLLVFSDPRAIIIGSLAAIGLLTLGGPISKAIDASQTRATVTRDPTMTFSEERGYDRIVEHPEYLLLGAGEGAYERFRKPGEHSREIHSSFGTVLFGYGLVGIALFMTFGVRLVRGSPLRMTVMLVPVLAYTVAHQGLRFTMFWVVVAVFVVLKSENHAGPRVPTRS